MENTRHSMFKQRIKNISNFIKETSEVIAFLSICIFILYIIIGVIDNSKVIVFDEELNTNIVTIDQERDLLVFSFAEKGAQKIRSCHRSYISADIRGDNCYNYSTEPFEIRNDVGIFYLTLQYKIKKINENEPMNCEIGFTSVHYCNIGQEILTSPIKEVLPTYIIEKK